ncbi:MAG TPA: SRPBCC domain-containing protein [Candidatus Limnocylindrales bacterium]|jgi:uncharacterized protein YndB with AHSA1/START domain|nr:SRPBCC domain-containing protein [Candidatus Limnocylindrales bacterium]
MPSATVHPTPIQLSIETPADPEVAWEALTEPDRVAEWFTDASPVGRAGEEYRLDFGDSVVEGSIVEVELGRRFSHTWRWDGAEEDDETLVTWTVEPLPKGGSRISLEHSGWPATTSDDTSREDHQGYWQAYLEDLAALLAG